MAFLLYLKFFNDFLDMVMTYEKVIIKTMCLPRSRVKISGT